MDANQPERYGEVTLYVRESPLVPGEAEARPGPAVVGLWGPERTVPTSYGSLRTALYRPSELGIDGFDHLFTSGPAPVARHMSWEDVARLRAALQARAQRQRVEKP
ncbi:MAG TPA: hypothetical protein VFB73_06005 [Chloroflexota bacterium]|nr:hypothetical protein [Chloroflexota bacterium]